MITVMSMAQRLFANNPETAKSYIRNSLWSCSWNITPVSEQLINQLVKTLYQLREVDTRVKFIPIIDSLPRLLQGMSDGKKLAFFATLCNSSVGQLTLFCERLTVLISACAFTQIQPLYYALQLPNDFDSIVQKLMAIIKGRNKEEQDLICKTFAGLTPKVIKLLFVPDKALIAKKKGYDLFLKKLLDVLINLILGPKGSTNIGELDLMLQDDQFVELLEKYEFLLNSIGYIPHANIILYKLILNGGYDIDVPTVAIIANLDAHKVEQLVKLIQQQPINFKLEKQLLPTLLSLLHSDVSSKTQREMSEITDNCLRMIIIIGAPLLQQARSIRIPLPNLPNGLPSISFFQYIAKSFEINRFSISIEVLNTLKDILQKLFAKAIDMAAFTNEVLSLAISPSTLHRDELRKADLLVELKHNVQSPAKSEIHSIEKRQAESSPENGEKKRAVQVDQSVTAQSITHLAPPINNSNVAVFTRRAAPLSLPRLPSINEILSPQLKDELGRQSPGVLPHIQAIYPHQASATSAVVHQRVHILPRTQLTQNSEQPTDSIFHHFRAPNIPTSAVIADTNSLEGLTSSGHKNNIHQGSSANYFPPQGPTQQYLFREQIGTEAFLKGLLSANKLGAPAPNINRAASHPISAETCLLNQQAEVAQAVLAPPRK